MVEEVSFLKKDFKQKENKYLADVWDIKTLKQKVKDKLIKQDQSLQTIHMLCRPRPNSNALNRVAIGYKNPLCLTRSKQVQPALYNGHEIIKDNHTPAIVYNSEDTLEIAEITKKKMNDKMNDPECVTRKVKIAPHDYSKENLLATFTPQKQLTPEQIFWFNDLIKLKSEALKERTKVSRPIKAFTVYPPNTPATLVPKVLPTATITNGERGFEQTKACYLQEVIPFFKTLMDNFEVIQKALTKEVKEMKNVFEELEAEVAQYAVDRKHDAIELKNLLIANDNLIDECLSQEVFCVATNSELNVARFTEMHVANITAETRCLALEDELANLRETNNHDNQKELINHFSKLEAQNDLFRAENDKIKQHYKECMTPLRSHVLSISNRKNRDAHLDYLRYLKESVETIRDIVEEAKPKSHVKANRISPAKDKMADVNAPSGQTPTMAPHVRANDQILPHIRAFTASSTIPSIYIQQFWDTILYDKKDGCYKCQLDEQWFDLTKETLREALQITPVNHNQAFAAPPSIDGLIDFVNQLGYPKLVMNLSNVVTNDLFQPWRALLTIINLCLTRKTSGFERPRAPVLQILWGIVTRTNIDYVKRIWEEFTQSIHTFIEHKRNMSRHTSGKKKDTLIVISSIRFTKLIIHHLQRKHRFHPRPDSPLHLSNEEPVLGYLKFSAKGTKSEVFGMPIPDSLITVEIQQATYYREYLAKVTHHRKYLADETGGVQNPPAPKPTQPARKPKAPTRPSISIPFADEDADYQKALEESMKDAYALPKGPLPPVVIREPESGKYQPLPEVPGKGKAKVTEKQVAHDLLSLKKHKKTSPADQYIFQRRVSEPTGSFGHDESPYALLGQSNNKEESEKVVLEAKEGGQDEGQAGPDPDCNISHFQAGSNPDETFEGQAGSNPDETSKGQAGPDPSDAEAKVQSISSHVVHAGSDREHMDLDVADVSPQPSTEQLDECDKHSDTDKNAETEVESIVNVTIQQALSSISLMTSPIIDLISRTESPKEHQQLKATTTDTTTTTTMLPPPQAPQQSTTEAMMVKHIGELEHILADLIQVNKNMEERLDKHRARLYTLKQLDIPQQVSIAITLEKSMNRDHSEELTQDLAEARKKKKKSRESLKTPPGSPSHQPPPLPPPAGPSEASGAPRASGSVQIPPSPPPPSSINQESPSKGSAAPSLSKTAALAEYQAWMTTDIRLRPSISLTPADLEMDEDMAPDEQAQSLDDEDIGSAHILTTGDIATFIDWFCKRRGITKLKPQDLEGPAYEIVKVFHPDVIHIQYQMEECHKLLTDSMDDPIIRHNGHRPALSISKMKAAYYTDAGLEQMVPDQFWIEEECKYDIAAMYGISHWWFQRQRFYIDRHTFEGDRSVVRTHMQILSVVRIEVFSVYGYDYMKKIVLHRADLNEHVIAEQDFKYLYPSYFEDLYLLNLEGHLNHLPPKDKKILTTAINQWTRQLVIRQRVEDFQLGIGSYQTHVNLTKPQWTTTGFEYKHDYTVIEPPRAVIFRDKYGVQMMMRFNEIHKFSDGILLQIDEALDYRVKEFRINMLNPGLNTRFWTRKDVDQCNVFMFAIQRRLKTRRIFRNLESFVGGRVREGDCRLLRRTD
nr:integrase, catalytic region, zinc finger, CCHC-type, peptidase aspartic, catalytic [Tanacetum cinerariifolium]